jgi:probable rRNA maturation factor
LPRLRVAVVDGTGRAVAAGGLGRWLAKTAPASVQGAVTIALISDARVRTLNRDYRGVDHATDVLSFPASDGQSPAPRSSQRRGAPRLLGDIVIANGISRRQARDEGHLHTTELRVLALHGLLHLLGYDHEAPDDAGAMARIERRWRRRGGLGASLIERVRGDDATPLAAPAETRRPQGQKRAGAARRRLAAPAEERRPEEQERAGAARRRLAAPADARRPGKGPRSNQ